MSDSGITVDSILNRPDDTLPYGLFHPQLEGKLTWVCNYSQENNIVSVFNMDLEDGPDRKICILKDLDEAKHTRDELIKHGWVKLKPPRVELTNRNTPLNRREKRSLKKKIVKMKEV